MFLLDSYSVLRHVTISYRHTLCSREIRLDLDHHDWLPLFSCFMSRSRGETARMQKRDGQQEQTESSRSSSLFSTSCIYFSSSQFRIPIRSDTYYGSEVFGLETNSQGEKGRKGAGRGGQEKERSASTVSCFRIVQGPLASLYLRTCLILVSIAIPGQW